MDLGLVLGGLLVGVVVGLTGMGGGALMTPMLVFIFGINPLTAVSSDLVTTALMKPFGGAVHAARRTVNWRLVGWLAAGGVPSGFAGVLMLRWLGDGAGTDELIKTCLGVALLLAAFGLIAKAYITMAHRRGSRTGREIVAADVRAVTVRPLPTVLVGMVGGLVVGMTSVGSGSIIIVALLVLYPALKASQLVGTDLVQAVPLVSAAACGHLIFGDFQLAIAASLLLGSIPGTVLGALISSRARGGIVRRALALVLLASGLKLLGVPTTITAVALIAALLLGPLVWMAVRYRYGLPPSQYLHRRRRERAGTTGGQMVQKVPG